MLDDHFTTERLQQVAARFERTLEKYEAMPFHALLYRLGEVSRARLEPYLLTGLLGRLVDRRRPNGRGVSLILREPIPRLYVAGKFSEAEADRLATEQLHHVRALAHLHRPEMPLLLARELGITDASVVDETASRSIWLARGVSINAQSGIFRTELHGVSVLVWVTHEPDWIQPDDGRLWHILTAAHREGRRPLIVARKIATATFPLLRVLHAQGVQYYCTFTLGPDLEEGQELRERLGWSYVRSIEAISDIPLRAQIEGALQRLDEGEPHLASEALSDGINRGFHRMQHIAPAMLLEWWSGSGLDLPSDMVQTLEGWSKLMRSAPDAT